VIAGVAVAMMSLSCKHLSAWTHSALSPEYASRYIPKPPKTWLYRWMSSTMRI
jgi:hypothetical protein